MQVRTDLAMERPENDEFTRRVQREGKVTVTRQETQNGTFITASVPPLSDNDEEMELMAETIGKELRALLPKNGTVLVVGLGNEDITPDALGPLTAKRVLATRHIRGEFARVAGLTDLRPVAVMLPGVLGQSGVESREMVAGLCQRIEPAAVIAVDALAAKSLSRLGCTVQLSDAGIAPGSGVGNNRKELTEASLGIPVIGMGVPTVVDAATLVGEFTDATPPPEATHMMVTSREIDLLIRRGARLGAMAINAALQPDYSPAELTALAGL